MKRNFTVYCLLFGLLSITMGLQAQPAQRFVQVIVSPDHSDWKYELKEKAAFNIQVYKNNVLLKNVEVDYELGPELFPTEKKEGVMLKNGELTLRSSMSEPGFLRCKVTAKVDGERYGGMTTVGYVVDKIRPTTPEPKDFDTFWSGAIADARKMPLDGKMVLLADKCSSTHNAYEISFQNERSGSRVYGMLTIPKATGKYPAILCVPGAGIRPYSPEFNDGCITLTIGIHGLPVSLPDEVYRNLNGGALNNYPFMQMNKRDSHYYKRVFLGCVRAVDFIYSLPEFDGRIGVTGGSQGGALSIVTAALDQRIKFLAAYYPAMCDFSGYLNKRAGGWPHYFKNAQPQPNEVETLAYFDVVNFASRVKAPGWFSWGFNDTVCPPTSMYAAYNVIPATKELHLYLDTGHWTYPEQREVCNGWIKKQFGIVR